MSAMGRTRKLGAKVAQRLSLLFIRLNIQAAILV